MIIKFFNLIIILKKLKFLKNNLYFIYILKKVPAYRWIRKKNYTALGTEYGPHYLGNKVFKIIPI